MNWTEENTAELIRLRAEGKSFSEIGRALGCTRDAAIGKLWRVQKRIRQVGSNKGRPIGGGKPKPPPIERSVWDQRTFAPYAVWKAERQKERERGLR